MKKRIISKASITAIVVATFFSVLPVFGATNYSWSGYAQTPGSSIRTAALIIVTVILYTMLIREQVITLMF